MSRSELGFDVDYDYDQGFVPPRPTPANTQADWAKIKLNRSAADNFTKSSIDRDMDYSASSISAAGFKETPGSALDKETSSKSDKRLSGMPEKPAEEVLVIKPRNAAPFNVLSGSVDSDSAARGENQTATETETVETVSVSSIGNEQEVHSVDQVPQVLDQLNDSLPANVPTSASLPSRAELSSSLGRLGDSSREAVHGYWTGGKQFLEQFFSHEEEDDSERQNEAADDSDENTDENETSNNISGSIEIEEKDPQHMTALEKAAYAYKLVALEARHKTIILGQKIDEKQRELNEALEAQSVTNQVKETVQAALASLKENATLAIESLAATGKQAYSQAAQVAQQKYSQAARAVDSNVHQVLGVRPGQPINAQMLLNKGAETLAQPLPVVLEASMTTVDTFQAVILAYFASYKTFYTAIRQQSMPMQVAHSILFLTHLVMPLCFLDKSAARSVLEASILVIISSHLIFFLTGQLKFVFLAHAWFLPMSWTLLLTGAWSWEDNGTGASVLEMPWYELPLHPFLIRAYFYGVWVRLASMTTAMILTLDSITINALYQRYLLRRANSSSSGSETRVGSGQTATWPVKKRLAAAGSAAGQTSSGVPSKRRQYGTSTSANPSSTGTALVKNKTAVGRGGPSPSSTRLDGSSSNSTAWLEASPQSQPQSQSLNAVPNPTQKWLAKKDEEASLSSSNNSQRRSQDETESIRVESHERPGLTQRKHQLPIESNSITTSTRTTATA